MARGHGAMRAQPGVRSGRLAHDLAPVLGERHISAQNGALLQKLMLREVCHSSFEFAWFHPMAAILTTRCKVGAKEVAHGHQLFAPLRTAHLRAHFHRHQAVPHSAIEIRQGGPTFTCRPVFQHTSDHERLPGLHQLVEPLLTGCLLPRGRCCAGWRGAPRPTRCRGREGRGGLRCGGWRRPRRLHAVVQPAHKQQGSVAEAARGCKDKDGVGPLYSRSGITHSLGAET
mmetsp:Transcript_32804/g.90598  ORF Transcript_32804/g.90598 Transcript_32804/m.90598 type:complete len:229 (-) Transcript_32804:370-1056(-)